MTPGSAGSAGRAEQLLALLRSDGVTLLTVYVVLLIAIPSRFVVGALGGAGSPFLVVGMGCLIWWVAGRIGAVPPPLTQGRPVRTLAGLLVAAFLASFVAACVRPTNPDELRVATLGLLALTGWMGVLLLAHDAVGDRERLETLLGRLSLAAVLLASLGLFQFVTNQSWVDRLTIPGLTVNNGLFGVQEREGFTRPAGTAIHPIEFGVVLAMLLPLVLARAGLATQELERTSLQLRRWGAAMVVAAAIALSSSRSAFVCAAVGVAMVLPRLDRRARWVVASGAGVLAVFVFVMVPGMLGSMLGLFTGIETDTSALSRVDSYGVALTFLARAPVLGRGFATFSPSYRIFDNQYLLSAVELGLVGVGLLVALFLGAIVVGSRVARTNTHNRLGLLSQGLVGGVATGATGFALFDALSFPMVPGLLFMLIGLVGACGQIAGDRDLVPERAGTSSVVQPPQASVVER